MSYEFEPACRRMEWLDPFYKEVWEKAFADAIPISGTFELTCRCNFQCRMCYVHLQPDRISEYGGELSAKEWLRIAKEAKEAGTVWLCITGGEPLLHPEFETIYRELSQMGFFITLQTTLIFQNFRISTYQPLPCITSLYTVHRSKCYIPQNTTFHLYSMLNKLYMLFCILTLIGTNE